MKKLINLAEISTNGQITVPAEVRRALGLKSGDKILFTRDSTNGRYYLSNASEVAIIQAQSAFSNARKDFAVSNEEDIQVLVDELRYMKR